MKTKQFNFDAFANVNLKFGHGHTWEWVSSVGSEIPDGTYKGSNGEIIVITKDLDSLRRKYMKGIVFASNKLEAINIVENYFNIIS